MNLKRTEQENHLTGIVRLLSMYQSLAIPQIAKLYPELSEEKLRMLIRRLEKEGRLVHIPEQDLLLFHKDCIPNPSIISAFWVLLDFQPDVTYHSISEFPVSLTFYTDTDAYDVIYIPEEKEMLINHALSSQRSHTSRRLIIVTNPKQIPHIKLPGVSAFCIVATDGQVQYYKKQGVTEF